MAKAGRPGALGLGITASFVGGCISWLFLITLSGPIALYSTRLGFDFRFGITGPRSHRLHWGQVDDQGVLSASLGVLASLPGIDKATGTLRMTFGFEELNGGLKLLPVLIGMFAISQIISDLARLDEKITIIPLKRAREMLFSLEDWNDQTANLLRSSVIGTWIGILPGISVASVLYPRSRS